MNHAEQINQLFQAAQSGDLANLQLLLASHPELTNTENQDGLTPLGYASHYGQAEVVRLLLEHGANVNALSHSKISFIPSNTALHAALAGERSSEVIQLLLEYGASTRFWTAMDNMHCTRQHFIRIRSNLSRCYFSMELIQTR
ncbi:ankyrin repeat protein [Paenibacillus xylanexedens]|uniref:ankyrin repeat domain-containing protein n=1 Tax=Paenibacillus xylanexedens TaxID=528191 RepID=UPI0034505A04|nr:ankyrin repeat protein [Paenibacillus xylanexedens]